MSTTLTWGILGTGAIAKVFARGLAASTTGKLVAIGSRTQEAANTFGAAFNVAHCYNSYDALLADDNVQAVYIATPHPMHAEWSIKAAHAGKHILCEKPIALNSTEASAIVEAARRNHVFLMEAFMYRCHPQTAGLIELIRSGIIGDVRVIQATFSFDTPFDSASRLLQNALGGGGILDVGGYPVSMARLIAGAALGQAFADPVGVQGMAHLGNVSRVDEYAVASLKFPGDILAQVFCGVQVTGEDVVHIFGTKGSLFVPEPWLPARDGGSSTILLKLNSGETQEIVVQSPHALYALEADTVAASIAAHQVQAAPPAMSWNDTLGNMKTLDRWRASIGLVYDSERQP